MLALMLDWSLALNPPAIRVCGKVSKVVQVWYVVAWYSEGGVRRNVYIYNIHVLCVDCANSK